MKKFFVLSIVAIIAITGAACQKEEEPPIGSNFDGGSSTESMVVFDVTQFEPAAVYATTTRSDPYGIIMIGGKFLVLS